MEIKKPETFEDLMRFQKRLCEAVGKKRDNGFIPRERSILDIYLSLDDEFQEWLRELPQEYNFKTWKEKIYSREKELEEFTDCLFFFVQYQNSLYSPNPYEYDETLCAIFNNWGHTYKSENLIDEIQNFKFNLWSSDCDSAFDFDFKCCFESWIAISKLRGFTKQEILDKYFNKWQKNMERIKGDWTLSKVKEYANEKYKRSFLICGPIGTGLSFK